MDVEAETAAETVTKKKNEILSAGAKVELELGAETLTINTGVLAKQADGAVFVTYGESAVLVCATTAKPWREQDFFPLTVDYREKTAAAGKFPGGFIKREGRPTQREILTCRCIDRPVRPLFPGGFKDEVQVLASVLSADPQYDPDVLAMIGAFAALHISRIPFYGAGGAMRVGRVDGELILMPSDGQRAKGDLDLIVSGTSEAVSMVEAGALELGEDTMLEAIEYAHAAIRKIAAKVDELRDLVGVDKIEVPEVEQDEALIEDLQGQVWDELRETLLTTGKHEQKRAMGQLRDRAVEAQVDKLDEDDPDRSKRERQVKSAFSELVSRRSRRMVLDEELRTDGRSLADIRPISIHLGILPRVHGSAVFTRGETQSLTTVTLGTQSDEQRVDGLREAFSKRFYLDYNFPPYSVGECKPIRGPGRREIGHGMLAERALEPLLPKAEEFPYTVRVISDILESNGSSSMATVCAGSLAMMQAGVPVKPVAGIAMGLISENDNTKILSDILGSEDHHGDMDFKVAGTRDGVTALQMDIKIRGLSTDIMRRALAQARDGRLHILDCMREAIPEPSEDLSPYAPRILRRVIPVDKIGFLIGPGGKNIRMIQERTETTVEVDDTGEVLISGHSKESLEEAAMFVDSFTKEIQLGEKYEGTVIDVKDFGAFVELYPGQEALCHVSELADSYVENVTDVVKIGDPLKVTVINVDPSGKVKVSAKTNPSESSGSRGGDGPRGDRGRGGRGGGRDGGGSGDRHRRSSGGGRSSPRGPSRPSRPSGERNDGDQRPSSGESPAGGDREDSDSGGRRRRRRR
jgi:polyribonucleotide nucleotidyltransferase